MALDLYKYSSRDVMLFAGRVESAARCGDRTFDDLMALSASLR
jgi:hypothetical protein